MKSYLLYAPQNAAPGDQKALESVVVLKDAFAWLAFLAPVLWFLYFRNWLAAFGATIVLVGVLVLARILAMAPDDLLLVLLALRLFVGLEANAIRGWTLRRRGLRLVDAIVAGTQDEAECILIRRWLANEVGQDVVGHPAQIKPVRNTAVGVVGLFPEPEGGR